MISLRIAFNRNAGRKWASGTGLWFFGNRLEMVIGMQGVMLLLMELLLTIIVNSNFIHIEMV